MIALIPRTSWKQGLIKHDVSGTLDHAGMRHEHEKTLRAIVLPTAQIDTEMAMGIEMRARDEILANSSTTPKRPKEMCIRTQTRYKNGRFATQSIMRKVI